MDVWISVTRKTIDLSPYSRKEIEKERYKRIKLEIRLLIYLIFTQGFAHVPYGEVWVVERFGKFSRALPAGVHLLIPGVDSVKAVKNAHTVSMGVTTSSVKAKDGSLANGYAVLYFNVTDYEQVRIFSCFTK